MDNEEYIYDEGLEQEESGSYSRKQRPQKSNNNLDKGRQLIKDAKDGTLKENVEKVKSGIGDMKSGDTKSGVSKIMDGTDGYRPKGKIEEAGSDIKNFGEGMKKVGEGAEKAGKSLQNSSKAGKNISDAGEKAAKAAKQAGKALETAGRATEAAGRGMDAAGKATSAGGKAASTAGDAVNTAGLAADATVVGAPVGVAANVAGTVASIGGKATEAAGAGEQAAGQATIAAGQAQKAAGQAQQAGAKAAEVGAKAGKKAGSFGEKFGLGLEKTGKKVKETGEAVKDFGEKVEKVGKNTTSVLRGITTVLNPVKMFFIILITGILALIIFFAAVLYPLFTSVEVLKKGADMQEKFNNFTWGLGFGNSIDSFYSELDFLNTHYEGALNEELLMATLFYVDILNDRNVLDEESAAISFLNDTDSFAWGSIYSAIGYFGHEALTETDDMGRVYSANKTFRLKKLTKNMTSKSGDTETASFEDYFALNADIIGSDFDMLDQNKYSALGLPSTVLSVVIKLALRFVMYTLIAQLPPPLNALLSAALSTELFKIDMAESDYLMQKLGTDIASLVNYERTASIAFEDLITMFTDIEGIEVELEINDFDISVIINEDGIDWEYGDVDDAIAALGDAVISPDDIDIDVDCDLEYEVFSYDEDKYEEYLKTEYLRNMTEFREYITDDGTIDGNIVDEKVDELYENIWILSKVWEEVNEEADGTALYRDVCRGNINPNLISMLALPIHMEEGDEVVFTNKTAFGVMFNGKKHNGVDLTEASVGTHVGDPVFAIYDGTVDSITKVSDDQEYYELKIRHEIPYHGDKGEDKTAAIYSVYGGLDPSTITVTEGATVTKGQTIIGNIGDAIYSEDGVNPGVHFAIFDIPGNKFLDPINIFITCSKTAGDGICTYDSTGGLILRIPDTVLAMSQMNYSATCYGHDGWYRSKDGGATCPLVGEPVNETALQYQVHKMWVKNGETYTNGIATMRVDNETRYLVATTAYFGQSGDIIDATLENGEVIHMIIADIKAYGDTGGNETACSERGTDLVGCYGHHPGDQLSVLEFEVDPVQYNNGGRNPSRWNQEWDTTQKVVSITRYGSILGDNVREDEICEYTDNGEDYDPGIPDNATGIIPGRLDKFLEKNGSSIEEYQASIDRAIQRASKNSDGYCTRNGSIAVAVETISFMTKFDAKLPYYWGGEYDGGVKGVWGARYNKDPGGTCKYGEKYQQCGLDCAGFVGWILKTAGYNVREFDITSRYASADSAELQATFPGGVYVENISTLSENERLRAGDILFTDGHIMFIVKVNSNSYTIAHAAGVTDGIEFGTVYFTSAKHGIRMERFYNNPANCAR